MFELIICDVEKHEWQQIIVTGGMTHQYIVGVQVRRCVLVSTLISGSRYQATADRTIDRYIAR